MKTVTAREFYHNARLVDGLADGKQLVVTANGNPKFVVSKSVRPRMTRKLGYKCRRDVQHSAALGLFDHHPDAEVLWTPWQRVEVLNGFCQAERAGLLARGDRVASSGCWNRRFGWGIGHMSNLTGQMQCALRENSELNTRSIC
jgi:hypothetical protein